MSFESADEITYEMADIQRQIITIKNKKYRTLQEQEELEALQAKLTHERKRKC